MSALACRLYLITPPEFSVPAFSEQLRAAVAEGDVGAVQLRLKNTDDDAIRTAIDALLPIARDHDVPLILNDRPDLARQTGCDGVHIGQQDTSYHDARAIVGPGCLIGVTCHNSRHLAMEAGEQGADYVAFGAFFPTSTKQVQFTADLETLEIWQESMLVPCVAIGGITLENCRPLVTAGADFLAVVSGVWGHPDGPARAVSGFNRIFRDVAASGVDTAGPN